MSVVELIVAFVLCILVFIFIMQVVSSIEELHLNLGVKTELLNKQSLISEKINEKLNSNNIVLIKKCGNDCFTFIYKDNSFDKMEINKTNNTFSFGSDVYNFDNLGNVISLTIDNKKNDAYNHGILTINLNIKNNIFEDGKYLIKAYYQYNETETIYSNTQIDKPEIFLFGTKITDFSSNKFKEPGWIVYYPSGNVTINENDVVASEINYDSSGNAYIIYTGVNSASGATAKRNLKKVLNAKEQLLTLYENNGLYLYSGTGKYVYKGTNPDNYILVGNKLFRILDLEIQNNYKLDSNNNIIKVNNEKQLEDKYLLKVVSNEYLRDANNTNLAYGIAADNFTTSAWISNNNTKYLNRLVNQVYLQGLLNTGARKQIKSGIFNIGLVDSNDFNFASSIDAKRVYDEEGLTKTDPGTWSNCTETKCEPNAAILSLTDVLFAGPCTETVSNSCLTNNWLIKDTNTIRLITRSSENETWALSNNLVTRGISSELKARVTMYLDANLYMFGDGTLENPYILCDVND